MDGQMFFKTLLQKKNAPIQFSGQDETISFPVKGSEVSIIGSSGDHEVGSSKLHIKNIVKYAWEHKYYSGQVVCDHMAGDYMAWSIVTPGKNVGSVRVVNRKTTERTLLKGMQGAVVDVSFAHIMHDVVIGCVDELGNLFVYRITENSSGLMQELVLEVLRDKPLREEHRLAWCPYLKNPDDDEVEEEEGAEEEVDAVAYQLLVTHGEQVEIWDLLTVFEKHGTGSLRPEDVTDGLQKLNGEGVITDGTFSPDGEALVTASSQGQVKFYQVYMKGLDESPRCLRQWAPHGGKPVSSITFLDDHSQYNSSSSSIWKYAVTGSQHNTELKVWSCATWTCLQTIRFQPREGEEAPLRLKITSDSASKYLILSDIDRNLVYVLTVKISDLDTDKETAQIVSVTELQTPSSFLSMSCVFAGLRQVSMGEDGLKVEEDVNLSHGDSKQKTVIKMFVVQPKSLQECSLIFDDAAEANLTPHFPALPAMPAMPPLPTNGVTDLASLDSAGIIRSSSPKFEKANSSSDDLAEAASKINLISPAKLKPLVPNHPEPEEEQEDVAETENDEDQDLDEVFGTYDEVEAPDEDADDEDVDIDDEEDDRGSDGSVPKLELVPGSLEKDLSGNSSPSREVATILSSDERKYEESPKDSTLMDAKSPVAVYKKEMHNTSLSSSTKFPTPPALSTLNTSLGGGTTRSSIPSDFSDLSTTMTPANTSQSLVNMILDLQKEVQALRNELYTQQKLSTSLQANIEKTVSTSMASSFNKMEHKLKVQEEALMKHVSKSISTQCDQVLTMELKRNVADIVNKALDPLKSRIDAQISNKLNNSEQVVKDSVYKVVNSQGFQDNLSRNVTQSLQPIITESYRNILQASLPGIEKSLQQTLSNVNQAFLAGTKEYETALRSRLEASERTQREEVTPLLKDLKKTVSHLSVNQNKVMHQMNEMNDRLENNLTNGLTDIVRREVRSALQNSPMMSAPSPAINHTDVRDTIKQLISMGKLNEALQKALSANDLSLVMFTCERMDPALLFESTPPCPQSVILSLLQQLSSNLQDKTELKVMFLEEALVQLDFNDQITKTHAQTITANLKRCVQEYIQNNPNSKHTRRLRTFLMAINGIYLSAAS